MSEHQAFEAMYDASYRDLLRFVQRRADPQTVDDVVSETFEIAWRRRDDLPDDYRPWLFRTASHLMRNGDRARVRRRLLALRSYEPESGRQDPGADVDFIRAWHRLSASEREALALRAWDGLSDTEAAAVLGCGRSAYTMRLTRARRHLAALLDGQETRTRPVRANDITERTSS